MTLSKVIRAQDGLIYHNVAPQPRKQPDFSKKSCKSPKKYHVPPWQGTREMFHWQSPSALSGDQTGVTLATNHSIFNKWPWVKIFGPERGLYIKKWLPDHENSLIWPKNLKAPQNISRSPLTGDLTGVTLTTNHSIFIKVWSCPFGRFDPSPSNVHNLSMPLS